MTWLLAGVWKLKGIRRNKVKEDDFYAYVKRMSDIQHWILNGSYPFFEHTFVRVLVSATIYITVSPRN